jgi:hypothetical protein
MIGLMAQLQQNNIRQNQLLNDRKNTALTLLEQANQFNNNINAINQNISNTRNYFNRQKQIAYQRAFALRGNQVASLAGNGVVINQGTAQMIQDQTMQLADIDNQYLTAEMNNELDNLINQRYQLNWEKQNAIQQSRDLFDFAKQRANVDALKVLSQNRTTVNANKYQSAGGSFTQGNYNNYLSALASAKNKNNAVYSSAQKNALNKYNQFYPK